MRRWCGLDELQLEELEADDGNGMWFRVGVSP
jgi:hypothetical protein